MQLLVILLNLNLELIIQKAFGPLSKMPQMLFTDFQGRTQL